MAVRVDLDISLDGVATTTDRTPENPFLAELGAEIMGAGPRPSVETAGGKGVRIHLTFRR
jgi:hypothetical protein